jgi:hypothetical protein
VRKQPTFTLNLLSLMSDNQPSGTLGGLISGLFRGRTNDDGTTGGGFTSKHKVLSGALLAAGAAYLYKRSKAKQSLLGNS